jgi:hypothetical protein
MPLTKATSNVIAPITATGSTTARTLDNRFSDVINVKDFGAVGNGISNDTAAIQAAINFANSSAKKFILIPSGTYKVNSQLETYSNVTISGDSVGTTTLDFSSQTSGHFINTTPQVGATLLLSTNVTRYGTSIGTTTPHGAAVGDKYAILSQRNALSRDGGDWQLGIGTGSLKASYYSEILNVSQVTSPTAFTFYPPLIFPNYNINNSSETPNSIKSCNIPAVISGNEFTITLASGNTTGLVEGMFASWAGMEAYVFRISAIISSTQLRMYSSSDAGVSAMTGVNVTFTIESRNNSDIRKITFVENPTIQNLRFISGNGSNKINFYGVSNGLIKNCGFSLSSVGEAINYINCYNTKSVDCSVYYTPEIATTFTYNPFSTISSWNCGYEGCKIENAFQGFDVTYSGGLFGSSVFSPSVFSYVNNCTAINCVNGMTSHSGSYGVKVTNNAFLYCNTGVLLRSPNTTCTNNFCTGDDSEDGYGIYLGNYAYKALVSNNSIEGVKNGIYVSPRVSTLGFGIKNLQTNITSNIIKRTAGAISVYGSDSYHKSAELINLIIDANTISESSLHIELDAYSNGISITGNNFIGPISTDSSAAVIIANNCFSINIRDNTFSDINPSGSTKNPISVGSLTDTTVYPLTDFKYKTNMVFWSGNKFFGNTLGCQQFFSTGFDPNIDNKFIDSGSYTPTIATQSNVSSVTVGLSSFSVKDRVCTISGRVTVTPTLNNTSTQIKFQPPIPSDFNIMSTNAIANGVGISSSSIYTPKSQYATLSGDTATNTVSLSFYAESVDPREFRYIYQYPVI